MPGRRLKFAILDEEKDVLDLVVNFRSGRMCIVVGVCGVGSVCCTAGNEDNEGAEGIVAGEGCCCCSVVDC